MRSDSVQSDQKSVQEEAAEEEAESSQDKRLPGDWPALVKVEQCFLHASIFDEQTTCKHFSGKLV